MARGSAAAFAAALLLLVCCCCDVDGATVSIRASIPGLFTLTLTQTSTTANTTYNMVMYPQAQKITGFGVYEVYTQNCSNIGNIFNPLGYTGNCTSDVDCAVGDLSTRFNFPSDYYNNDTLTFTNLTLSGSHMNLPLSGNSKVDGRTLAFYNENGTVTCVPLGLAPGCTATQYRTALQTTTTATQCSPLTFCNPLLQYISTASTLTSDRICEDFTNAHAVSLFVRGATKAQLFQIEKQMTAAISDLIEMSSPGDIQVSFLRRLYAEGTNSSTPAASSHLELWVVAANKTSRTVIPQSTLITTLNALQAQAPGGCQPQSEAFCRCNTSLIVPTVSSTITVNSTTSGCFDVEGDSYCVPINPSCSASFPATTVNLTRFTPFPSLRLRSCPVNFVPSSCLEVATQTQVESIEAAPSSTDINVQFPPLPAPPAEYENFTYTGYAVDLLRDGARFFRNKMVQPKSLPYDAINYQLQYSSDNGGFDMSRAQSDAISWGTPFAVVIAISILFFIFLPTVMLIMACCRCCKCCCCHNCCGGSLHTHDPSKWRCVLLALFTFLFGILIVAFGAMIVASDKQISSGIDAMSEASTASLDNVDLFKNNTLTQVADVPDVLFPAILEAVFVILDNINAGVAFGIVEVSDELTTTLIAQALLFADEVDANVNEISTLIDYGENTTSELTVLAGMANDITTFHGTLKSDCDSIAAAAPADGGVLQMICDNIPALSLSVNVDASASDIFGPIRTSLQSVSDIGIRDLATEVDALLNSLPNDIQAEVDSVTNTINTEVNNFKSDLKTQINDIRKQADDFAYNDINIEGMKSDISSLFSQADPYEGYTFLLSQVLTGVFVTFGLLIILATIAGSLQYNSSVDPEDRSSMSNCCAKVLLGSIGILTIICTLVHLLLVILFFLSSFSGKTCDGFQSDAIIQQVVDNPANWGDSYILSDALYGSNYSGTPLTVEAMLDNCRENQAVFSALSFEAIFNISEYTDFSSQLNLTSQLDNLVFDNYQVVPDGLVDTILDYSSVGVQDIDTAPFEDQLQQLRDIFDADQLNMTYEALESVFVSYAGGKDVSTLITQSQAQDARVDDLINKRDEIVDIQTQQLVTLDGLIAQVSNLTENVQSFARDIDAFQDFFVSIVSVAFDIDKTLDDVKDLANEFITIVTNLIDDDIAPCGLLSSAYDGVIDATCDEMQKGLDAWWFTMALATMATLCATITGIKLSAYFRRGKTAPPKKELVGGIDSDEYDDYDTDVENDDAIGHRRRQQEEYELEEAPPTPEDVVTANRWVKPKSRPKPTSGYENFSTQNERRHRPTSRYHIDKSHLPPLRSDKPPAYEHAYEYDEQRF
eukprot:m.127175 g.127175  ORF g.127175 m.127175 type:complete len:1338 (+) comp13001_c0_seq4:116-4129(+)